MTRRNSELLFATVLTLLFVCAGCDSKESEQQAKTDGKKVMGQMTSKTVPVFMSISSKIAALAKYDFSRVRDPFHTTLIQATVKQARSTVQGKLVPTQKFEIDKYKLIGVMIDKRGKSAIFEDPEGKGWIVREGTPIGNEGAKIRKISAEGVTVEEVSYETSGKARTSEKFISIKKVR